VNWDFGPRPPSFLVAGAYDPVVSLGAPAAYNTIMLYSPPPWWYGSYEYSYADPG